MLDKFLIFVALIAAASVAANVIPTRINDRSAEITYIGNNLYVGKRTNDDWMQRRATMEKPAVESRIITEEYRFVTYFDLTYFEVIDNTGNVNLGANSTMVSGGPGQVITVIHFTSQRGQPIDCTLRFYVRYPYSRT